jgi:hypothetical protein
MPREITKLVYTFKEMLEYQKEGKIGSGAVEKVRTWLQQTHMEHDWWEYDYELWTKALAEIGFEEVEIRFSGFWCQGDGASFTSKCVDLEKLTKFLATEIEAKDCIQVDIEGHEVYSPWIVHCIKGKPPANPKYTRLAYLTEHVQLHIERDVGAHYVHWNTCTVHQDLDDPGEMVTTDDAGRPLPSDRWDWKSFRPHVRGLWSSFVGDVETLRKDLCQAIYDSLESTYEALTADEALIEFSDTNEYAFDMLGSREYP